MVGRKTKTIVKIGGREYTITGEETAEYIHKVAIYVDRKMQEIEKVQHNLSTSMIAVLTAVNLADEVIKLQEEITELNEEIRRLQQVNKKSTASPSAYNTQRKIKR